MAQSGLPTPCHFEIKKKPIGVIFSAEAAKRRQITLWLWSKIAVENPFAVFFRNPQFVFIGIKELDSVLRTFGEWGAMPWIFVGIIGARLGWPAQPGISSLVRRGAKAGLTSLNLTSCIAVFPVAKTTWP